jgi:indole-3-glycerol phosphate synthase
VLFSSYGQGKYDFDYLFEIANKYSDAIAIHTHEDFGGSFELLKYAKAHTNKEIVAKGFHYDS